MSRRAWTARVLLRYAAFQVPGIALTLVLLLALQSWLEMPSWGIAIVVGMVILKDVVLFPFVWRAYRTDDRDDSRYLPLGARGVAQERLASSGYVRLGGERWRAVLAPGEAPLEAGERFRVVQVRGLTVVVRADKEDG